MTIPYAGSVRTISPKQMEAIFCSPGFLGKCEAAREKPTAIVFQEASDEEVRQWLKEEGYAMAKKAGLL